MLKVLDCFAGIGGFSLGLERTQGFQTVGFVEIDPFCRRVLAKHWPDVPCHDDITTREFKKGEADVITAGWPCQDLSYAGNGAGLAGERSGLWRMVVRAVRLVRPLRVCLENVAALLGRGLGTVLGDLATLGYDAEWHCIPAGAVGASHERDRIWIVANPAEVGRPPLQLDERVTQAYESRQSSRISPEDLRQWPPEAVICRASDGLPNRLDRVGALGNSLYPIIPEIIGSAILAANTNAQLKSASRDTTTAEYKLVNLAHKSSSEGL